MRSYTALLPSGFETFLSRFSTFSKGSYIPRIALLAIVVITAAIVGPQGLAVGPSQTRSMTPALATGAAMDAETVLGSITLSLDMIRVSSELERRHASYPQRQVGPLSFPQGAIDIPWVQASLPATTGSTLDLANTRAHGAAGSTISAPSRNNIPSVFQAVESSALTSTSLASTSSASTSLTVNNPDLNRLRSMVIFDTRGADLSSAAVAALNDVAAALRDSSSRIQLLAYGGSTAERSHTARRLALRRALAVRNYLMQRGVDQEQISVRALGGATDGAPPNRVDVISPTS